MRCVLTLACVLVVLPGIAVPMAFGAEGEQSLQSLRPARPYLGARLSSEVPDLLRKHLRLEPEQGLLVENIFRSSPADKAGLEKDDILLSMNGKPLKSPQELFRIIRDVSIGGTATVELIRLGKHIETSITFEAVEADFWFDLSAWKYPIEPEESMVVRPGRMFQMRPGERDWIEIPFDPSQGGDSRTPNIGAQYHFLHDDGQKEFTVVIEGNPNEPGASVTVKTPDKEYFTTAGQIEMLPQEYQQTVKNDIDKARKSFENGRNMKIPSRVDFSRWHEFLPEGGRPPRPDQRGGDQRGPDQRGGGPRGEDTRLESQLENLNRQIEELLKQQKALEARIKERAN